MLRTGLFATLTADEASERFRINWILASSTRVDSCLRWLYCLPLSVLYPGRTRSRRCWLHQVLAISML